MPTQTIIEAGPTRKKLSKSKGKGIKDESKNKDLDKKSKGTADETTDMEKKDDETPEDKEREERKKRREAAMEKLKKEKDCMVKEALAKGNLRPADDNETINECIREKEEKGEQCTIALVTNAFGNAHKNFLPSVRQISDLVDSSLPRLRVKEHLTCFFNFIERFEIDDPSKNVAIDQKRPESDEA
ncbi:hypothetical protein KIN20_034302 [Parelaphostrongylus tenuis]|uniref:Uncharacterized protein n=1 Tax=Parelaphostrongylus tenuis TaxID=148309 RepID=A0AAD5R9Y8_PARTN|nr:hypothetical protein KIN20_034302 [Parelaphostrongylus tenuis]